ncbi:PVC-type heme-binding CxxCH protein [Rosistilla oblonga]|uniref:PVC-type heme-binding CxxCH protein n=1 Tax=Rosistilla oblonga TaxID=2527990 RepID=UPI003A9699B5
MKLFSAWNHRFPWLMAPALLVASICSGASGDEPTLVFDAVGKQVGEIVLVAGDEEYRSEESMPMLGKILSQKHGFKSTVVFSLSDDGSYIDPNNSTGLTGLAALDTADLMIIGTRFRAPRPEEAAHLTEFMNAGKPVIGIRTATHAFNGKGSFGDKISFAEWGRKILGEQWVSHHGKHKSEGARGVIEKSSADHPILNSVEEIFAPSDVYGVIHLTDADQILMRGAVTESLDPKSPNVEGEKNDPMQPFAWLHTYEAPNGTEGKSFCTTAGAAVDLVDEDLRRMLVNAAYFLTGNEVPKQADVAYVDPFYPSFFGFIREKDYWKNADLQPSDFGLGKSPAMPDPKGSPAWDFRPTKPVAAAADNAGSLPLKKRQRIAVVGNALAEGMNQYGNFEALLQTRFPEKELIFRNFGWPADEVANQQRPGSYTTIDDPMVVFAPDMFLCFFGFNESFQGREPAAIERFIADYRKYIETMKTKFAKDGKQPTFVLVSPVGFEATGNPLQPDGVEENKNLAAYTAAIAKMAAADGHRFVDLHTKTSEEFAKTPANQFTINGVHLNEQGDRLMGELLDASLFDGEHPLGVDASKFQEVRKWVNDKSWYHLQDYRMLNGWYVYGGRRTWDTETFPTEYRKIRNIVAVRDQYVWDLAAGRPVADQPDDSNTGEVYTPETMFGTRDENFRKMREPEEIKYPSPEESIEMMTVPEGFKVELFASEREFPELANPNQIAFDSRGRLWVSCMANYPQWQPGSAKPSDRLLIFEDTDGDGKADKCTPFYDKLICPTGFEFWNGGVLVVDEPRILFLKDTDGDDRADEVTPIIDGIATDDTHHTMGAWEFSHGGLLHMLEGVALSTTLETPWGPFRNKGTSGGYIFDLHSLKFSHYRTPGYGNPWCLVFDEWGNGIVGDGTNAKQHWVSPLSGLEVNTRRTMNPVFDNQGMRPAVGNEFLWSRQFPDDVQGQFIYACVINMHGMPRFNVRDEAAGAGFEGERVEDLLSSTDMVFRPVDPKIGPDGALWFGDWCNALIGHMQYSQRDPNRDHQHGRIFRLVYENKPLLEPITQAGKSIDELLEQLKTYELRTRYRVRREIRDHEKEEVYAAIGKWIDGVDDPKQLCEAMWIQESFRDVDTDLLDKILATDEYRARAAAIHTITNEMERIPNAKDYLAKGVTDPNPRVRLEAVRGLSFLGSVEATELALKAVDQPMDYWLDYTLEHTLHALEPAWKSGEGNEGFLANSSEAAAKHFDRFRKLNGPGGAAVLPLEVADDVDASEKDRKNAIRQLAKLKGGHAGRGVEVFKRVCSACHMVGDVGKKFGPDLSDIGRRFNLEQIISSIIMPNEEISKGYETVMVLTIDGATHNGFILSEDDETLSLGIANGKQIDVLKDDIDIRKPMKASSMPEGLVKTIAPVEFLDLIAYLQNQKDVAFSKSDDGWIRSTDKNPPPMRTHGEFKEISRDAEVKLGDAFGNRDWNNDVHLFLNPLKREKWDFSFHSQHDADKPALTIRLAKESEVRHIELKNRLDSQFHERAEGLTVWTSTDGKDYQKVWAAEKPAGTYSIDLPAGTRAKYVRIGLDGKGTFHLFQGVIYGK